jgi:hypothetical protein
VWSKSSIAAGSLMSALQGASRQFDARSPFVATSGHADDFGSARALADSVRNGMFLDSKLIPVCMEDVDTRGQELNLNAYVVDFYKNQHFYSLLTDNRLSDCQCKQRREETVTRDCHLLCLMLGLRVFSSAFAWNLLKSWSLLLSAITTALRTLSTYVPKDLEPKVDPLVQSFDHLSTTFDQYFSAIINV